MLHVPRQTAGNAMTYKVWCLSQAAQYPGQALGEINVVLAPVKALDNALGCGIRLHQKGHGKIILPG